MKKVFDNRQLAHVWAQQSQPEGRGSNFFFEGPAIFSYGRHFKIAEFVTRKGKRAVLFTSRRYSVSTSKHISYTRGALAGLAVPVFTVPDIDAAARAGYQAATRDYYRAAVGAAERASARARKTSNAEWEMARAARLAAEANAYAEFYGLRWRVKTPEFTPERLEAIRAAEKREAARKAARTKAQREADRIHGERMATEYEAKREAWRRGELATMPSHPNWRETGGTMLRLSGDRIETSRGAHIPASAARLVWDAVQSCRASGLAWEPIGADRPHIGAFTLDRVTAEGDIVAGCHLIEYAELARMSVALGFES